MSRIMVLVFVAVSLFAAQPLNAQELPRLKEAGWQSEQRRIQVDDHQAIWDALTSIPRLWDIAMRESLKQTSGRDLRFRCGRYWVDNYSRLIAPTDRDVGIWGIDLPSATPNSSHPSIRMLPMRR